MALPNHLESRPPGRPATRRWQTAACAGCILLGLLLTLNIQPVGDGMWFWYARLFNQHQRLYSEMHLPLQPLFVLLTAWLQRLISLGWLASKTLAVAQLLVFCACLWGIVSRLRWSDRQRAALFAGTFVFTVTAGYFRFDDYHVTGYCCVLGSLHLLLGLRRDDRAAALLLRCAALGVLTGLALGNRLNDGAALLVGSAFAIACILRKVRLRGLALLLTTAVATLLAVVLATADTLTAWRMESIVRAAATKGGGATVLLRPLAFFRYHLTTTALAWQNWIELVFVVTAVWLLLAVVHAHGRRRLLLGTIAFFTILPFGLWQAWGGLVVTGLAEYILFTILALAMLAALRALRGRAQAVESLLAIPLLLLLAGIVTGGRELLETFPPIAFTLLLLPFCAAYLFAQAWQRQALTLFCLVILVCGTVSKIEHPYYWSHFNDRTMFTERTWYRHPLYGPIYVERDQLALFEHICAAMDQNGKPPALLAITNPYANWFCDVPPWHGYVQTWYDTSSRQTIEGLVVELKTAPPTWIVYQRAPDTLAQNEQAFGGGKPLAHRDLDRLILERISTGAWQIVYEQPLNGTEWMVIRTERSPKF